MKSRNRAGSAVGWVSSLKMSTRSVPSLLCMALSSGSLGAKWLQPFQESVQFSYTKFWRGEEAIFLIGLRKHTHKNLSLTLLAFHSPSSISSSAGYYTNHWPGGWAYYGWFKFTTLQGMSALFQEFNEAIYVKVLEFYRQLVLYP